MSLKPDRKHNRGFTLLDLTIGAMITTIFVVIALHNLLENPASRRIRKPATRNLRAFAHGNQLDALKCEGQDKNGDGWVLCEAKDRQGQIVMLQCGYDQRHPECNTQGIGSGE